MELNGASEGNVKFQQYRTLFHQEMLATSMRQLLPDGLLGLFMLLMVLAMISTDNSRIYSSAVTVAQAYISPRLEAYVLGVIPVERLKTLKKKGKDI